MGLTLFVLLYLLLIGVLAAALTEWLLRRGIVRRWVAYAIVIVIIGLNAAIFPELMWHRLHIHGVVLTVLAGGAEGWKEYLLAFIVSLFLYGPFGLLISRQAWRQAKAEERRKKMAAKAARVDGE